MNRRSASLPCAHVPRIMCACGWVRTCFTSTGLSAGTELLTVRYLSFAAPGPPSFEYICCNELVGAAAAWTPDTKYLIKQGPAGAEQVRSLQHTLDRRGRAYDEVTGRLRFARDVIYEMPSNIPNSSGLNLLKCFLTRAHLVRPTTSSSADCHAFLRQVLMIVWLRTAVTSHLRCFTLVMPKALVCGVQKKSVKVISSAST